MLQKDQEWRSLLVTTATRAISRIFLGRVSLDDPAGNQEDVVQVM
jgi:hypothetical protein